MKPVTWNEVYDYCRKHEESDGFCCICNGCSGPTYSNLSCDYTPEARKERGSAIPVRGGNGSCYFEVLE